MKPYDLAHHRCTRLWILLMMLVFIPLTSGCLATPTVPTSSSTATPDLSSLQPEKLDDLSFLPAKTLFPYALEIARAWHKDARLVWIGGNVSYQGKLNGLTTSYHFTSETDATHDLLVSLKTNQPPELTYGDKPGQMFQLRPVLLDDWLVDIGPALQLTLKQGGTDFLTTQPHPQIAYYLDLANPQHRLVWRISYSQLEGYANAKEFDIDAKTGQLFEAR